MAGIYAAACQSISGNIDQAIAECEKMFRLDEADLFVLPELASVSGEISRENILAQMDSVDDAIEKLLKFSRKTHSVMVVGLPRQIAGGRLQNAACVIDDGEILGWYAKSHLETGESDHFVKGDELGIFQTRVGSIGVMLGEEGLITEVPRLLAMEGAEILAWPCRWKSGRHSDVMPLERALENQVYVVAATPAERGVGHSQVVSPRPYPVPAQRAILGPGRLGCIGHMIVPATSAMKLVSRNTDVFAHRQPQAYTALVNS